MAIHALIKTNLASELFSLARLNRSITNPVKRRIKNRFAMNTTMSSSSPRLCGANRMKECLAGLAGGSSSCCGGGFRFGMEDYPQMSQITLNEKSRTTPLEKNL